MTPWHDCERFQSRPDGARPPLTQPPRQLAPGPRSASASCRVLSRHLAHHSHCRPSSAPPIAPADRLPTSNLPEFESGPSRLLLLHPPSAILAPSIGGFGISSDEGQPAIGASRNSQFAIASNGRAYIVVVTSHAGSRTLLAGRQLEPHTIGWRSDQKLRRYRPRLRWCDRRRELEVCSSRSGEQS